MPCRRKAYTLAAHLEEVAAADTLIVRSHGESKDFFTEAAGRGIHIVDATCPFVKKIHDLVEEAYAAGYQIVILGDAAHPGGARPQRWCENTALVVHTAEEARRIHADNLFGRLPDDDSPRATR